MVSTHFIHIAIALLVGVLAGYFSRAFELVMKIGFDCPNHYAYGRRHDYGILYVPRRLLSCGRYAGKYSRSSYWVTVCNVYLELQKHG